MPQKGREAAKEAIVDIKKLLAMPTWFLY